jgi:hypothetical protein
MSVIINGTTGINSPGGDVSAVDNTVSGLTVGKGGGSVASNTVAGYQAGYSNTTGADNTFLGQYAGYPVTTGSANTFVGKNAGNGTAITGDSNTGIGGNALQFITGAATANTAVGRTALYNNTTASNNVAVGYQAGYGTTTGANSVYVGTQAGHDATTGQYNCAVGHGAGYKLTTGSGNSFFGSSGSSNSYGAGYYVTTGNNNTIIGAYTGNQGGLDIRTASNYIVLADGDGAPSFWRNSNGQWSISSPTAGTGSALNVNNSSTNGYFALVVANPSTNHYAVGFQENGTTVGTIITTSSTTAYNTSSDYRLKENVQPMTGALNTVAQLKPVTYKWKIDGRDGQGFIAHELAEVVPDAVAGEKDAVDTEGNPVYQGIDTSFLVATLTAAIQELKAEFDAYKATHP